jgi:hypothetical protein
MTAKKRLAVQVGTVGLRLLLADDVLRIVHRRVGVSRQRLVAGVEPLERDVGLLLGSARLRGTGMGPPIGQPLTAPAVRPET